MLATGAVIQGADTAELVATLPWWRIDDPLSPGPDPGQDESQVLAACDFWLGVPFAHGDADTLTLRLAAAEQASVIEFAIDRITVADADQPNEIDLAAAPERRPGRSWWLGGLIVVLGGALAAGAAETYLIIRRSRWARLGLVLGDRSAPLSDVLAALGMSSR